MLSMRRALFGRYMYCNNPPVRVDEGKTIRWVVMGMGGDTGMHSPVFTGQEAVLQGTPAYSVGVLPATTAVMDMRAASKGDWEVYCSVLDHFAAGMRLRLTVT